MYTPESFNPNDDETLPRTFEGLAQELVEQMEKIAKAEGKDVNELYITAIRSIYWNANLMITSSTYYL